MSEYLAVGPALPNEPATIEGRLAMIIAGAEVKVDGYTLSNADRLTVVAALIQAGQAKEKPHDPGFKRTDAES